MSWLLAYVLAVVVAFIILYLFEGKTSEVVCWCAILWPATLTIVILAVVCSKLRRKLK